MLTSVIFSGPPGTGKTTLARIVANTTQSQFLSLNAVLSGVKDVREAIEAAREHQRLYGRKTILFVDEVHRWNKAQQDALLPWVESGTVILIGATTENPFFEVNSALVSRSRVFQLKALDAEDLRNVGRAALADRDRGYGDLEVDITDEAFEHLVQVADGDARSLLNALQLAVESTPSRFPPDPGERIHIDMDTAEQSIQKKAVLYDKEGDYHFDTISAFIKSLRGSDPDAGLYWLARMVKAGEDPHYIFRRMLVLASEDVGLADPHALSVVEATARAFDRVGMPEGQYHLTQAVLYLATAEKSNSALGYFDALAAVERDTAADVPVHLKDPNRDREGFGHGEGYLYPHAYREHWVAQSYLPGALQERLFYQPSNQGYEARIRALVERRRELQIAAMEPAAADTEVLTYARTDRSREQWLRRALEERNRELATLRDATIGALTLQRHEQVLVLGEQAELLLWEAVRHTPEGRACGLFSEQAAAERAEYRAEELSELERPAIIRGDLSELTAERAKSEGTAGELPARFDGLAGLNVLFRLTEKARRLAALHEYVREGGRIALTEIVPREGSRLSEYVSEGALSPELSRALTEAEDEVYHDAEDPRFAWTPEELGALAEEAGLTGVTVRRIPQQSSRTLTAADIRRFCGHDRGENPGAELHSPLGRALARRLSAEAIRQLSDELASALAGRELTWRRVYALLTGTARLTGARGHRYTSHEK
jgi:putative ATPase